MCIIQVLWSNPVASVSFNMPRRTAVASITLTGIGLLTAGKVQTAPPHQWSADLSVAAPAYASALKAWNIPPDSQLEFLGDDQLAIAVTSEFELNSSAAMNQRPRKPIKLLIELFKIGEGLEKSGEIELPTDNSHSRIGGLPSGRLLVRSSEASNGKCRQIKSLRAVEGRATAYSGVNWL